MTAPTNKLDGAMMTDELIDAIWDQVLTKCDGHISHRSFARALLSAVALADAQIEAFATDARQHEAMEFSGSTKVASHDNVVWSIRRALRAAYPAAPSVERPRYDPATQPGSPEFDGAEAYEAHLAATCPPDSEPSVEHDERGAFDIALDALDDYQRNWDTGLPAEYVSGERIAMECAVEAVREALNEARAASTSADAAAPAQSVVPVAWFIADDNGKVYRSTGYEHERDQWRAVGHKVHPLYAAQQAECAPREALSDEQRDTAAGRWASPSTPIREALAFIDGFDAARALLASSNDK